MPPEKSVQKSEATSITSPGAERAYRTLKLAMSKHQATREEQLFFKLEMKAEAHALRWGQRRQFRWGLFWLYEQFADYGFSVARPFLGFVGSYLIFLLLYALLHSPVASEDTAWVWDGTHASELVRYALAQMPLPGLEGTAQSFEGDLFPAPYQRIVLSVVVIMHKLAVLLFLFLIGLGLRNTFKMK
jgi:hypothetical protein